MPPTVPRASSRGSSRDFPCGFHPPGAPGSERPRPAGCRQAGAPTTTVSGQDQHPRKAGGSCAGGGRVCRSDFRTRGKKSRGHERGSGGNIEKETSGQPGLPLRLPGGRPALLAEPSSRAGEVEGPGGPESPSPPDRTSQGSVCPGKAHRFMASPLPIRLLPQRPRSQTAIPAISPPTSLLSTKELRDFLKASTEQRQTFG